MGGYVTGGMPYRQYLQQQSFVDDIRWEVSRSTLDIVASLDDLKKQGIKSARASQADLRGELARHHDEEITTLKAGFGNVSERLEDIGGTLTRGFEDVSERLDDIDSTLTRGFVTLHCDLQQVTSSISELSAKFDWGIEQLQIAIGGVNDSLEGLIRIARTPEQTWAYEQFDIARDAFRREFFDDALAHITKAIQGFQTHTGYRLDYRFHYLLGTLRLGSRHSSNAEGVQDLGLAESAFLDATKYVWASDPKEAGRALAGAGYAAYCQNRITDAVKHNSKAIEVHPKLPEAYFLAAKYAFHQKQVDEGLLSLKQAIELDRLYAVKFDNDDDFRPFRREILDMIALMRDAIAARCQPVLKQFQEAAAELARFSYPSESLIKRLSNAAELLKANTYLSVLDAASSLAACRQTLVSMREGYLCTVMQDFLRRGQKISPNKDGLAKKIGVTVAVVTVIVYHIKISVDQLAYSGKHPVSELIAINMLGLIGSLLIFFAVAIPTVLIARLVLPASAKLTKSHIEAQRDEVLKHHRSILDRAEKAFSDPWWNGVAAQVVPANQITGKSRI